MLIDAQDKFRFKKASNQGAKGLYHTYIELINLTDGKPCSKSIAYLRSFVQYPTNECLWIIRKYHHQHLTISGWGDEYLHLITSIAAYYLDEGNKPEGLLWAVKALDLVDHFAPTLKRNMRESILTDMLATSMVCAYPNDFHQRASDHFFLDWEINRFYYCGHQSHFNDNE